MREVVVGATSSAFNADRVQSKPFKVYRLGLITRIFIWI